MFKITINLCAYILIPEILFLNIETPPILFRNLCRTGWLRAYDSPASASYVLKL